LRSKLKPEATALASDQDTSGAKVDLPPPTKDGVVKAPTTDEPHVETAEEEDESKWWKVVGGQPQFGDGTKGIDFSRNLSDQETWVEQHLEDKWFGGKYIFVLHITLPLTLHRLVFQCRCHYLRLPFLLGYRSFGWWSRLGVSDHGDLLNILSNIDASSA
jgi:hypothetical protein